QLFEMKSGFVVRVAPPLQPLQQMPQQRPPRNEGAGAHKRAEEDGIAMADNMSEDLESGALVYHRLPKPGKLEIQATKPLGNQRDLALAYSPGVAAACMAIHDDPQEAATLTIRQNLVAVLSNGTAVLGLGDIGPLAS